MIDDHDAEFRQNFSSLQCSSTTLLSLLLKDSFPPGFTPTFADRRLVSPDQLWTGFVEISEGEDAATKTALH